MKFGLNESTIRNIRRVFLQYPQISKVILYGSRAKGNYKNGSDIDLCIIGNNISMQDVNRIHLELDNLDLPYTFDISNFKKLNNQDLVEHILRVGIEIYP